MDILFQEYLSRMNEMFLEIIAFNVGTFDVKKQMKDFQRHEFKNFPIEECRYRFFLKHTLDFQFSCRIKERRKKRYNCFNAILSKSDA